MKTLSQSSAPIRKVKWMGGGGGRGVQSGVPGGQSHKLKVSEYSKLNFSCFRNGPFILTFQVIN